MAAPRERRLLVVANPTTRGGGVDMFWRRIEPELGAAGWSLTIRTGRRVDQNDEPWSLNLGSMLGGRRLHSISAAEGFDHVVTSIPQSDILWNLSQGGSRRIPWTIYVHGQPFPMPGESRRLKSALWKEEWCRAARVADGIIAVSDALATQVEGLIGRRPVVIPAPIAANAAHEERHGGRGLRVGFVGRLAPEKDPGLFADVAQTFAGAGTFHVFGSGPLGEELARRKRIELHGHVDDLAAMYSSIDVLAVTSRREGLSLASLEASSHGVLPVVAAVGGLPETIHPDLRQALCIPVEDRERLSAWHERLEQLRLSEVRAPMIDAQRSWVRSRFAAGHVGPKLARALLNIGGSVGSHSRSR